MVKDGSNRDTEGCLAVVASPPVLIANYIDGSAIGTTGVVPPSGFLKMFDAGFLVGKLFENLYNIHDKRLLVGVDCSLPQ